VELYPLRKCPPIAVLVLHEIDQMQTRGPFADPFFGHGRGVVAVDSFPAIIPLPETDAFAAA